MESAAGMVFLASARDGRAPRIRVVRISFAIPRLVFLCPNPSVIFVWTNDLAIPRIPADVTELFAEIGFRADIAIKNLFFPQCSICLF
jgi:hypothetical protein